MLNVDANLFICPQDADVLQFADQPLVFEKEHAYVGEFVMNAGKPNERKFELTEESIIHMAKEGQRYIDNGNLSTLPLEHTTDPEKNRGKNTKWYAKHDSKGRLGLFSITEFRDEESAKLAKSTQTSIYAPPTYTDGKGVQYTYPVRHVALTTVPVIPGLDGFTPIAASLVQPIKKEDSSMAMKDLAGKIGLQLSEEVIKDDAKAADAIALEFSQLSESKKTVEKEFADYKLANPAKTSPVKVSKAQVAMLKENRELKLSQLVESGRITPAVKKNLEAVFCGDKGLELCLSEDREDNFNEIISALKENDPIKLSENTGPQGGDLGKLLDSNTNVVQRQADKLAAQRKAQMS